MFKEREEQWDVTLEVAQQLRNYNKLIYDLKHKNPQSIRKTILYSSEIRKVNQVKTED